jgi:uncharacterized membrane protein
MYMFLCSHSYTAGNVLAVAGLEGYVQKCATLSTSIACPALTAITLQASSLHTYTSSIYVANTGCFSTCYILLMMECYTGSELLAGNTTAILIFYCDRALCELCQ